MSLDGLKSDGAGGVVSDGDIATQFGGSPEWLADLESQIEVLLLEGDEARRMEWEIAHWLCEHLTHEERMCALFMFYGADTAPCAGRRLCQLQKRVFKKVQANLRLRVLCERRHPVPKSSNSRRK